MRKENYLKSEALLLSIMAKVKVVLEDAEDGWLVVYCPDLPGCISQGKTREEALSNIKEAITCHLETLKENNDPIPPAFKKGEVEVYA